MNRQNKTPSNSRVAVIIGAGPAGLTAAHELLERTDVTPIVLEKDELMGGLSRTVNFKGNRIDIGGHRFFSKSDRVMEWWLKRLPLQATKQKNFAITYQNKTRSIQADDKGLDPDAVDKIMLVRSRRSRIYFMRKFFDYPISLTLQTLKNLGFNRTIKIGVSYFKSLLMPIRNEKNLEEFFINRFGRQLYLTFFKSYTEKVWGIACRDISAQWGAQRIKGLSIARAIAHFFKKFLKKKDDIKQKETETSLIEQFLYPKFGPGQMWEEVAEGVREAGGQILTGHSVNGLRVDQNKVIGVEAQVGNEKKFLEADFVFSTMPIQELVRSLNCEVPQDTKRVSEGLVYRDFITVGLLLKDLKIKEDDLSSKLIKDNWIYIQEPDVFVGRMQIFNNWSPWMVADPQNVWIGLEYFCYENDKLWNLSDQEMIDLACEESARIGIINRDDFLEGTVIRVPKTYPAYFGTYDEFDSLRGYLDQFENLFLVGRNGMHRYNNQDHSMLTAMVAVDNIVAGNADKANIWAVNTEQEYHEDKDQPQSQ